MPDAAVNDDWRDLLIALRRAEARFLVVGAHVMAVHGVPRGTQDLDVWVDRAADNAERVWRGLVAFGAPLASFEITIDDLRRPGTVIQLGLPQDSLPGRHRCRELQPLASLRQQIPLAHVTPAYSRSASPSGRCCALPWADN